MMQPAVSKEEIVLLFAGRDRQWISIKLETPDDPSYCTCRIAFPGRELTRVTILRSFAPSLSD